MKPIQIKLIVSEITTEQMDQAVKKFIEKIERVANSNFNPNKFTAEFDSHMKDLNNHVDLFEQKMAVNNAIINNTILPVIELLKNIEKLQANISKMDVNSITTEFNKLSNELVSLGKSWSNECKQYKEPIIVISETGTVLEKLAQLSEELAHLFPGEKNDLADFVVALSKKLKETTENLTVSYQETSNSLRQSKTKLAEVKQKLDARMQMANEGPNENKRDSDPEEVESPSPRKGSIGQSATHFAPTRGRSNSNDGNTAKINVTVEKPRDKSPTRSQAKDKNTASSNPNTTFHTAVKSVKEQKASIKDEKKPKKGKGGGCVIS